VLLRPVKSSSLLQSRRSNCSVSVHASGPRALEARASLSPQRQIPLPTQDGLVFLGVAAVTVAAMLPSLLSHVPILFAAAYAAVVFAIVSPVRMQANNAERFADASATLLSSASTKDHIQYARDPARSLPSLVRTAQFAEYIRGDQLSPFFHKELRRSGYASSLRRIIADPTFCRTLVTHDAWALARMLQDLAEKRLRSPKPNSICGGNWAVRPFFATTAC